MVELKILVQLHSPLLIGSRKQGGVFESLDYLPGVMLRGSVGELLARRCGHLPGSHAECDFASVFHSETQPRFGPCYPVSSVETASWPFPATARKCKYFPGFLSDDEDAHGISDALIPVYAYEEAVQSQQIPPYESNCAARENGGLCNARLDPAAGFYEVWSGSYLSLKAHIMRLSRTAINRQRRVAADELLYTLELLSERMPGPPDRRGRRESVPTRMRGSIWVDSETRAQRMSDILKELTSIGGSTSRGLGAVEITVLDQVTAAEEYENCLQDAEQLAEAVSGGDFSGINAPQGSLLERLTGFNQALNQAFSSLEYQPQPGCLYFTLDCLSDVIWSDGGLPTSLAPPDFAGAHLVRAWSLPRRVSGFSGASGFMRNPQLVAGKGSVFLYRHQPASSQDLVSTLSILFHAERQGLGRDRERGNGLVQFCSPFHLEVNPI